MPTLSGFGRSTYGSGSWGTAITAVEPSGLSSASAIGTPTILGLAVVSPSGIASTSAVGSTTVTQGAGVTIGAAGVSSTALVGAASVIPVMLVVVTGVSSNTAIGSPAIWGIINTTTVDTWTLIAA